MSYDTTGSDFIRGSLEDTNKYIEFSNGHHATAKQKRQVQIKICDDNEGTFIVTLHNVFLAPDLYDRIFSINPFMSSGHTCSFHKGFCTMYFANKEKNSVDLPHSAKRKYELFGGGGGVVKTKKISTNKEICFVIIEP